MKLDKIYAGFKVLKITPIAEIKAIGYEMEHLFSGAHLFYLQCDDDNKVFTIGFRTPSADDTGVAHIIEHSVLCGSRKYPLKEPFVELVKGSLNTFLNAMTYADKTVYPVASRNAKDFHNLMDVYLDAVFYPALLHDPYMLKQEGWHYEFLEGQLSYNGVVYNEMKGVYSAADAVEAYQCALHLFPDTPYRFESGGLPSAIPELTQERFTAFHRKHYRPENSYIYLYGDMDIEDTLAYLDREYLQAFPKQGVSVPDIPLQKPFERTCEVEASYPIAEGETVDNKTYLSLNIVTGLLTDCRTASALRLLSTVLLEGDSAPLRRALLDAGVAAGISGGVTASQLQPVFNICASGSAKENRDKFVSVIYRTLQNITVQGLDRELIEAKLNNLEFKLREADFGVYPKGLIYGLSCYDTWLYGSDPAESLLTDEVMNFLRLKLKTNYYEQLIENYLLDNTHKLLLTLLPSPGMEERQQARECAELAKLQEQMTDAELSRYAAEADKLHELQAIEDSPEALASIPLLSREDIRRSIVNVPREREQQGERTLLYLPRFTNKIVYYRWYFDITGVPERLMPYMYLLLDVLGKVNTQDFSYADLITYTNKYTGGISFDMTAATSVDSLQKYSLNCMLSGKVLVENLPHFFKILRNIVFTSDFSDKGRIKEIVDEIKTNWDSNFFAMGQTVAVSHLSATYSPAARVCEYDQLAYYSFIKELTAHFDERWQQVQESFRELMPAFFHRNKQLFAYCCEEEQRGKALQAAEEFAAALSESPFAGKAPAEAAAPQEHEAIATAGKVQYVVAGGDFRACGHNFTGAMTVLCTILTMGYLWTRVRVQGGAYGTNISMLSNGEVILSSYRDPQLMGTLAAYRELPEYLRHFDASEREMTKYVIGTISKMDIPLTNSMHLLVAAIDELKGCTAQMRQKARNEVLDVTAEDIRALAEVLQDVLAQNHYCVVGSTEAIEKNQTSFSRIIKV